MAAHGNGLSVSVAYLVVMKQQQPASVGLCRRWLKWPRRICGGGIWRLAWRKRSSAASHGYEKKSGVMAAAGWRPSAGENGVAL